MTLPRQTRVFSLEYHKAVCDVHYQLVAAFTFLVWDSILTFQDEVEYIWRMRQCIFKWFYFYFRYVSLATHIFHLVVSSHLSSGHTSDFLCRMWYRYVFLITQVSDCMIEIILATRVFALFNRSRKVGILFGVLILSHLGVSGTSIVQFPEAEYFEACILPYPQKEMVASQISLVFTFQSITIGMTVFKHAVWDGPGRRRVPTLSFLVQDAARNYVTFFLLGSISLAACGLDDLRGMAITHWSISMFSTIGCRLILNMERFARESASHDEILLTSHISL